MHLKFKMKFCLQLPDGTSAAATTEAKASAAAGAAAAPSPSYQQQDGEGALARELRLVKRQLSLANQENNGLKSENDALRAKLAGWEAYWERMDPLLSMTAEDVLREAREKTAKQE